MPAFRYGKKKSSERRTVCWREVDSNHRFRREGDGPGERSRGRPLSSRETTCDLSSLSVRDLLSATAERPFARAGPMVRIHFPKRRVYVHANQLIGARVAAADRAAGALW